MFFDAKVELGRKTHCAQHTHRVFLVALLRIANQAQQAVANVVYAVGVIEDALADRIVIQGIDREVSTLGVFFQGAVNVVTKNAAAFIARGLIAVLIFFILVSTSSALPVAWALVWGIFGGLLAPVAKDLVSGLKSFSRQR